MSVTQAGSIARVDRVKFRDAAGLANRRDAQQPSLLVATEHRHGRARSGKPRRQRTAQYAGRADYDRDFAGQIK